jgi:hypothetical protein
VSQLFPFDLPPATALYVSLYVVTLALHVVFMSYSLGGACYLALSVFRRGETTAPNATTVRGLLVDWLPFGLGLTITAGVAPLLFVQILYEKAFYTANLLLFYRWMMIVPILIVGFYLLYLIKSGFARARPRLWRAACVGAFACFAFVAWSWTENHLLSIDSSAWVQMYAEGRVMYTTPLLWPRLGMWFFGTWPVMAALVAWQLRAAEQRGESVAEVEYTKLRRIALAGLLFGGAAAFMYADRTLGHAASVVSASNVAPYAAVLALGVLAIIVGWILSRDVARRARALKLVAGGTLAAVLASGAIRESLRVSKIEMDIENHAHAVDAGGKMLFMIVFVVNVAVIVYVLGLARRAVAAGTETESGQVDG